MSTINPYKNEVSGEQVKHVGGHIKWRLECHFHVLRDRDDLPGNVELAIDGVCAIRNVELDVFGCNGIIHLNNVCVR